MIIFKWVKKMNREDFPILDSGIIYFDNGATTMKPKSVIDSVVDYYSNYTANAHRGDYDSSLKVDEEYEKVRTKVRNLINASRDEEIIYTSGTTESLNMVVFGYMKKVLKEGDEVLLTKSEHASNLLPWMVLQEEIGIVIKYIPLDDNYCLTIDNVKGMISSRTKVISIAHITNVIGDVRNIEEIGKICSEHNILLVVDAAQSIGHIKVDVQAANIAFLGFSAHKMLGPTGIGVLYGRYDLLQELEPLKFGGGMNAFFEEDSRYELKEIPWKFEAGTQNIAGVIGMGKAIDYIQNIGLEKIHEYELKLKKFAVSKLSEIPNIIIYNKDTPSGILTFNIDKVFSQDTAVFLNRFGISIRSGNHCAKILKDEIGITNTCRASFYLYNNEEEIMKLAAVLKRQDEIYDNIV